MGYGHSLDPRRRIIAAVEAVALAREAGRRFEVSASSAVNLVRRWRETGSLAPGQIGGQKKRRLSGYEDWLHEVMTTCRTSRFRSCKADWPQWTLRFPCRPSTRRFMLWDTA